MSDRPESLTPQTLGITIGAMSQATGIPANTLRTWERRYGFPEPDRTASGQRVYDPTVIGHLRLVNQALEAGHRPRQVLGLDEDQIRRLLDKTAPSPAEPAPIRPGTTSVDRWLRAVENLDGATLAAGFRSEAARLGVLRMLTERAGPFMVALGEAWRQGRIQIYQEHWVSEHLRSFLVETWGPLSTAAAGPPMVASSLPHDRHDLGLHMAASIVSMCGWRIVFLGRDTPVDDIAKAVVRARAPAALISISAWTAPDLAHAHLEQLRARLEPETYLLVGGSGSPGALPGITHLSGLEPLYQWASRPFPTAT
ncbi:MAG: MerR family DNA-binding transcriptional regulator [Deltaproteobacteria bacterium]|nr:MAG: MerR family DNA-binding transcriptional regulator [Deltaproteobacteria bacterium]